MGLDDLVARSDTIVIGRTGSVIDGVLSADGLDVSSTTLVRIEETLKGLLLPTMAIRLTWPGGKVRFADGTRAEVQFRGIRSIVPDESYVFFLSVDGSQRYDLSAGMQSAYVAHVTGYIEALDLRPGQPLLAETSLVKTTVFAERVRGIVSRQKLGEQQ
jgi:hypothetical protein